MKEVNDKLSKQIQEANEKLSKDIKEVNNKIIPLYVFLAVFSTAIGMANLKDLVAFAKWDCLTMGTTDDSYFTRFVPLANMHMVKTRATTSGSTVTLILDSK